MFRRRIGLNAGQARPQSRPRRNDYDAPIARRSHRRGTRLRQPKRTIHISRKNRPPISFVDVLDRTPDLPPHAASRIDENINPPLALDNILN